jgi:DNA-directed RNA polymerase subunit RPC12/RpoP
VSVPLCRWRDKRVDPMIKLQSTITCPQCGHRAAETMPTEACQYVYICPRCSVRLTPKKRPLLHLLLLWGRRPARRCSLSASPVLMNDSGDMCANTTSAIRVQHYPRRVQ